MEGKLPKFTGGHQVVPLIGGCSQPAKVAMTSTAVEINTTHDGAWPLRTVGQGQHRIDGCRRGMRTRGLAQ